MTVELHLAGGAAVTLDHAQLDRAAWAWSGITGGSTRMTIPLADTTKQRLLVDQDGAPVASKDRPVRDPRVKSRPQSRRRRRASA